jgi:hypothetical protein
MPTTTKTHLNYKTAAQAVLKTLKRDRDRQILAKRFGLGLARRQTLEQIGRTFGITRERVRQIEKAALAKIQGASLKEVSEVETRLIELLQEHGGVLSVAGATELFGAPDTDQSYIVFLSVAAKKIQLIDEDDALRPALGLLPVYSSKHTRELHAELVRVVKESGKPVQLKDIAAKLPAGTEITTIESLAGASKELAHFDKHWGLISWPQVNPKSIRDKTYLVLGKHGKPLHFTEISDRIRNSNFRRRDVTVQAVHNELIKDPRFVLIGRGIYALAEWGYTPGTVADIIIDVLRDESPLHKDEIVRRVLEKRQVRTTTIVLNLQEKDHFERVAKATYKLKDHTK